MNALAVQCGWKSREQAQTEYKENGYSVYFLSWLPHTKGKCDRIL